MNLALASWIALVLSVDALRRVYDVGREANDHFVALIVLGCMGFYWLIGLAAPGWAQPLTVAGMVGIWGLFFSVHRSGATPTWVRWGLAYPSQLAYAFALWGGLFWLIRAPIAWWAGWELLWPGGWLLPPLVLAVGGFTNCYLMGNRVRRYIFAGLPVRLVQLSDLHASPLMHRRELDRIVDRVNGLRPDLVVITGDLVMPFSEAEHDYLLDALQEIQAPTFACPGNHDLPILETLRQELADRGIPLLVDESIRVAGMEITGVNFHWKSARAELERAIAGLPASQPGDFRLLLAHDPRLGAWTPEGRFDLVLSGHTHGGQVAANMFGIPISMLRLFGVRDQGWWSAGGGRQYVHPGNWLTGLPPRMGVAGEITLFIA